MLRRALRYGDRFVVAVAGTALALQGIDRPQAFWDDHGYIVGISILAAAVFGVLTPFERAAGEKRLSDRERAWQGALAALDGIESATGIPLRQLTLHVWVPRRSLRTAFRKELARPVTVRVGYHRSNRSMRFWKGIGVVGQCWDKNDDVLRNDLPTDFAGVASEADWKTLEAARGEDFTLYLSYGSFQKTSHLQSVAAVPIQRGTRFVGCISVDSEHPGSDLTPAMASLRKLSVELAQVDLTQLGE